MTAFLSRGLLSHFSQALRRFAATESGATAIEYGLIAAMAALAAIPAIGAMGGKLSSTFGAVATAIDADNAAPPPSSPPDNMADGI